MRACRLFDTRTLRPRSPYKIGASSLLRAPSGVLLVLLTAILSGPLHAQTTGGYVMQGGTAIVSGYINSQPPSDPAWEIKLGSGAVVATSTNPHGWNASGSAFGSYMPTASISVTAPADAIVYGDYRVTVYGQWTVSTDPYLYVSTVPMTAGFAVVAPSGSVFLSSLSVSASSAVGGTVLTGTVTIDEPVQAGGVMIDVYSTDTTLATVPYPVVVPPGQTSVSFPITTHPTVYPSTVFIVAYCGTEIYKQITVLPAGSPVTLSSLQISPSPVIGGTQATGTVTLTGPAPAGGIAVGLGSSNTSVATVPPSVFVQAGSTTANFTVPTSTVSSSQEVTISASYNGASVSQIVTSNPSSSTSGPQLDVFAVWCKDETDAWTDPWGMTWYKWTASTSGQIAASGVHHGLYIHARLAVPTALDYSGNVYYRNVSRSLRQNRLFILCSRFAIVR